MPRRGAICTSPSCVNSRHASRTGVRLVLLGGHGVEVYSRLGTEPASQDRLTRFASEPIARGAVA
jgi:hypothetical protein